MTDPVGAETTDLLHQLPPFGDATASLTECAAAVERRAERLARIADGRADEWTSAQAQDAHQIAREAREEASKARLLADRARLHTTATQTPPGEDTSEQNPPPF